MVIVHVRSWFISKLTFIERSKVRNTEEQRTECVITHLDRTINFNTLRRLCDVNNWCKVYILAYRYTDSGIAIRPNCFESSIGRHKGTLLIILNKRRYWNLTTTKFYRWIKRKIWTTNLESILPSQGQR